MFVNFLKPYMLSTGTEDILSNECKTDCNQSGDDSGYETKSTGSTLHCSTKSSPAAGKFISSFCVLLIHRYF